MKISFEKGFFSQNLENIFHNLKIGIHNNTLGLYRYHIFGNLLGPNNATRRANTMHRNTESATQMQRVCSHAEILRPCVTLQSENQLLKILEPFEPTKLFKLLDINLTSNYIMNCKTYLYWDFEPKRGLASSVDICKALGNTDPQAEVFSEKQLYAEWIYLAMIGFLFWQEGLQGLSAKNIEFFHALRGHAC